MSERDEMEAHQLADPTGIVQLQISRYIVQELLAELDGLSQMGAVTRALRTELAEALEVQKRAGA